MRLKKQILNQDDVNVKIQRITNFLVDSNKEMEDRFHEFSNNHTSIFKELINELTILQNSNKESFAEMNVGVKKFQEIQHDLNHQLLENVQLLSSENMKLYLDQKKSLENQLELNLSEVKVLSSKTKESFSEDIKKIGDVINGLERKIQEQDEGNKKNNKFIRVLVGFTLGIGLINIIINFI